VRCGIALHASGEPLDYGARFVSAPARPPGWFKHPTGTVAYEFAGSMPEPARFASEGSGSMPAKAAPRRDVEVQIRKPSGHAGH
jgi:hypothetical protein